MHVQDPCALLGRDNTLIYSAIVRNQAQCEIWQFYQKLFWETLSLAID